MPQASTTLRSRKSPLAEADKQLSILEATAASLTFSGAVTTTGLGDLQADGVDILQVNVGKLCNMTCRHCHVDAGPDRREIMTRENVDHCLEALSRSQIHTLDLTGGAPEMNPNFRYFVTEARRHDVQVIDRCNLTILLAQGYEDLPEFLADHHVEIVASLPCYLPENTDRQRGDGTYGQSIEALRRLNRLGYGQPNRGLTLTLVFNPIGPSLPPDQMTLEAQYRDYLRREFAIEFTRLFTITNMPISRFLDDLIESNRYEAYMQTLIDAFNPAAIDGVMCRKMVSVAWDGRLHDCDFNQMLGIALAAKERQHIRDFDEEALGRRAIQTGQHCFGCTAAAGSGCLGAIDT